MFNRSSFNEARANCAGNCMGGCTTTLQPGASMRPAQIAREINVVPQCSAEATHCFNEARANCAGN